MERRRDLDRLLLDLESFLLILDRENLSYVAQAKKKSIAELLARLQGPPSEDAEYMIMRCISPSSGNSGLQPRAGTSLPPGSSSPDPPPADTQHAPGGVNTAGILPYLQSLPTDDSYEEAEPISPGGNLSSVGGADTDSSHYESYGEDEDCMKDRAHYIQWPPTASLGEAPTRPEAQLCGFLWRKRWLGQWAKQLFIIREHTLLCYKCAKDMQLVLELDLRGCRVTYKAKRSKKMQHELKVIEEVSSNPLSGLSAHSSPVSLGAEQGRGLCRAPSPQQGSASSQDGSVTSPTAAGSVPAGEQKKGGFLEVLLHGQRQKLWCTVEQGALQMLQDPSCPESLAGTVLLAGCVVTSGADTGQPLLIHLAQHGREVVVLEACSEEDRDAWLEILHGTRGAESASTYERSSIESTSLGDTPSSPAVGGLLLRRFPTPNAYMDDPFGQLPPVPPPDPLYSNADILHQLQRSLDRAARGQPKRPVSAVPNSAYSNAASRTLETAVTPQTSLSNSPSEQRAEAAPKMKSQEFPQSQQTLVLSERKGPRDGLDFLIGKRAFPKLEEKVGQLERACRMKTRLKAGSEMNLLAIGKSLKGHIATATCSAGSEGSFLTPLLKRTSSAKGTLKRAPSVVIIEKGKVLQKRKEWEMKSAM
ncbi:actin filament-associated protein 1-like 2 isoform X2 [Alligator mississippiensis]|uniref:actin filament-associated protein 1-like 2 isoform X2 n=1 Tax=Alligator mississippiensis TaxID=8496 RepID=UPI002877B867|nr:actin filament-associated protein 1-like 2 isoform X2 [Alligator mississippiensis]